MQGGISQQHSLEHTDSSSRFRSLTTQSIKVGDL
jgi:hypothetical protein